MRAVSGSLLRFGLVGLANTALGFAIFAALHYGMCATPAVANSAGFGFGLVLSYVLNRRFTFRSNRPHGELTGPFLLAAICSYAVNIAVLEACIRIGLVPIFLAQLLAMASYTIVFFLLTRYLVFNR